ncbi:MAG: nucleotidyltransferase family protein [Alphaproteobacteria bacterium]|nr:nucleotidyltransferase family protein [Alphaproteobacteria bacterium]
MVDSVRASIRAAWAALLGGDVGPGAVPAEWAGRLAALLTPAMADHLLSGWTLLDGAPMVPAAAARQSRLLNRLARTGGLGWARRAAEAGLPVVCLKGMGAAYTLYDDADCRGMSDCDLLVGAAERDRLLALLRAGGLDFVPPRARSRWGFVHDSSFLPLASADGVSQIDLHQQADAWPVHRALPAQAVFAAARPAATPAGTILVPAPTHALLLCATHAARDLFGPPAVTKLIDASRLLARFGQTIDAAELVRLAAAGGVARPVAAFFALLADLGLPAALLPASLAARPDALPAWCRGEYRRARAQLALLYPHPLSTLASIRREALLTAQPSTVLARYRLRLHGLLRPQTGRPVAPTARTALTPRKEL